MRLLYAVHQFFPDHYTGTERLALDLGKQMQRMGHSVTVLTYALNVGQGFESTGDFQVRRYRFQGVPVVSIRHRQAPEALSFEILHEDMESVIGDVVLKDYSDIVHVFHPMRVGTVVRVAAAKRVPVVLTLTDFWIMCPKGIAVTQQGEVCLSSEGGAKCQRECYGDLPKYRIERRLRETREMIAAAGSVVSATSSMKQVFERGGLANDVKRIPFGEDYSGVLTNAREYSGQSRITLAFMSTLTPHKGAHVLLEAYNIAKPPNISLRIYGDHFGDATYFSSIKKLAGHNSRVEFCGAYKYEDMTRILNEIDMIVVPSTWWENSPLVLSRALAHKVPAVVSDLGGMTEVVKDGVNGFSFEVSNAESLARVLQKIGNDPSILNDLKNRISRPPRIEEQAFEYDRIYRSLCQRN